MELPEQKETRVRREISVVKDSLVRKVVVD